MRTGVNAAKRILLGMVHFRRALQSSVLSCGRGIVNLRVQFLNDFESNVYRLHLRILKQIFSIVHNLFTRRVLIVCPVRTPLVSKFCVKNYYDSSSGDPVTGFTPPAPRYSFVVLNKNTSLARGFIRLESGVQTATHL